jgi:hypothetical protein
MEVGKNGVAVFELDAKGLPQVFFYGNVRDPASFAPTAQVRLCSLSCASPVWLAGAVLMCSTRTQPRMPDTLNTGPMQPNPQDVKHAKLEVLVVFLVMLLPLCGLVALAINLVFGKSKLAGSDGQGGGGAARSPKDLALTPMVPGVTGVSASDTKQSWFSFEQFRKFGHRHRRQASADSSTSSSSPPSRTAGTAGAAGAGKGNAGGGGGVGKDVCAVMDAVYPLNGGHDARKPSAAAGTAAADGSAGAPLIASQGSADISPHQAWLQVHAFRMSDAEGGCTASGASSLSPSSSLNSPRSGAGLLPPPHAPQPLAASNLGPGSGGAGSGSMGALLPPPGQGGQHQPLQQQHLRQQALSAPQASLGFEPTRERILHVALEYSIPHLGFNNQLMFGGLGMVVDTFIKQWPGPMSVIAPLYKACYTAPPGCSGTSADADGVVRPAFLAPYERPLLTLTVDAAGVVMPVEVFKLVHDNVTFYLVQVRPLMGGAGCASMALCMFMVVRMSACMSVCMSACMSKVRQRVTKL